jgi:VWFA-related protein
MRMSFQILFIALALPASPQPVTFSTDVKLVTLPATVRNHDGAIVKNLGKEDFLLKEDARAQTIRYFSQESNLPLTIGLLVDTSLSQRLVLEAERRASYAFLDQVLHGDRDVAFVLRFDVTVTVVQSFTSSRRDLAGALASLKMPGHQNTLLYDAVRQASEDLMKGQKGRKAFVLLSDGVDVASKTSLDTAIEYAQRADTMIYSILFTAHRRVVHPIAMAAIAMVNRRGRKAMQRLARETGGGFFEVSKDGTIEEIYARIEEELRSQYSLGYISDRTDLSTQYRRIQPGGETERFGGPDKGRVLPTMMRRSL